MNPYPHYSIELGSSLPEHIKRAYANVQASSDDEIRHQMEGLHSDLAYLWQHGGISRKPVLSSARTTIYWEDDKSVCAEIIY